MMRLLIALILLSGLTATTLCQDPPAEGEKVPPAAYTPAKTGDFWYGMYDEKDKPVGYTRITITETKSGGRHFVFARRTDQFGTRFEDESQLTLDRSSEMTYAEYNREETRFCVAREGNVFVGKSGVDDLRVEVDRGAISELFFLLAASMPLHKGAKIRRPLYSTKDGFKGGSTACLEIQGKEVIDLPEGKIEAWKVLTWAATEESELRRHPIWVNDSREIVRLGDFLGTTKLHRSRTDHLYAPRTLTEINPGDTSKLSFEGVFPAFTLEEVWKAWTTADGLKAFWAPKAEIEGKVGGKYWLLYPKENNPSEYHYRMLGTITHWEPNKKFGTTWHWDFEPDEQVLNVLMEFEAVEGGVKLKITHGKFGDTPEEQDNRKNIAQGWEFFCTKLKKLKQE